MGERKTRVGLTELVDEKVARDFATNCVVDNLPGAGGWRLLVGPAGTYRYGRNFFVERKDAFQVVPPLPDGQEWFTKKMQAEAAIRKVHQQEWVSSRARRLADLHTELVRLRDALPTLLLSVESVSSAVK